MKFLANFFKGIAISLSQIIPGVSGGTIAIILGIYDKLIHAVNNIVNDFKNQYKILLEVGIGAVFGIFLFSNIVKDLLSSYPIALGFLFIGVILGGAPLMYRKASVGGLNKKNWIYFFIGLFSVLLMTGDYIDSSSVIESLTVMRFIWLFLGGIIIAIALILPGISGSFMLLVLGLYNTVINAVTDFNIVILIPIALGAVIGTLASAKGIEMLLNKYPEQTYMLIFGFVIGSVYGIFPGFEFNLEGIIGIFLLIIGFIFICVISKDE